MNEELNEFEKQIIEIMIDCSCTVRESLNIVFDMYGVDKNSVIDLVDFLEDRTSNLDTVSYYMQIWTGQLNDMELNFLEKKKEN